MAEATEAFCLEVDGKRSSGWEALQLKGPSSPCLSIGRCRAPQSGLFLWIPLKPRLLPSGTYLRILKKNTQWALSTLLSWRDKRNEHFREEADKQVPVGLLASTDHVILGKWFSLYVAEVRKKDGTEYPPKTMYILLAGILRHMRLQNPKYPNFLDMEDLSIATFHNPLDNVLRDLRARGVGSESQQTEALRKEEERLWSSGTLGDDNPRSLLHTVFYLNGKIFAYVGATNRGI